MTVPFIQRKLERLVVGKVVPDQGVDLAEAGRPGRPPAALSRHDDVALAVRAHRDRLQLAVGLEAGGQLLQRIGVESLAGLVRVRAHVLDGQGKERRLHAATSPLSCRASATLPIAWVTTNFVAVSTPIGQPSLAGIQTGPRLL